MAGAAMKRPAADVADYFDLQLRFADRVARASGRPFAELLGEGCLLYTSPSPRDS